MDAHLLVAKTVCKLTWEKKGEFCFGCSLVCCIAKTVCKLNWEEDEEFVLDAHL